MLSLHDLTVDQTHTFYVVAGDKANDPAVLVHNCGELNLGSAGLDTATENQVTELVDIHDSNGGRLPDYINRGGGPGNVFENRPVNGTSLLPEKGAGYYQEADVWSLQPNGAGTAGVRGSERLVFGNGGEVYYTSDHYGSFVRLR